MLVARAGLVSGVPLMRPTFHIRPVRVEEAAALSDLCFRSKAVWGYDAGFMALKRDAAGGAAIALFGAAEHYSRPFEIRDHFTESGTTGPSG